jgi:RNA polymerase sigma-70 factor (ECF subfamily)
VATKPRLRHQLARIDDRELLLACRSGDRGAYDAFYRRHRTAILAYLGKRTPSPEAAADLMAETFAQALADVLRSDASLPVVPAAWLFTIARNLLVDSLRRGSVDCAARRRLALEPLVLDDEDLARVAEIAAGADEFRDLAAVLSAPDWELLRARLVDEIPYPDLAAGLKCSEAVVRKRVSRAKAHLRAARDASRV